MLWLLFSCSTPAPPAAQPPPEPEDPTPQAAAPPLGDWPELLGLMARSDEDTCAAIRRAWALEQQARTDPALRDALQQAPGFRTLEGQPLVHWVELSRAVGKSSAETGLVTVGGVAARLRDDCLDATSFAHWMSRSTMFAKTQPCTRDALGEVMEAISTPALQRACVCNPPGPDAVGALVATIEQLDMDPKPWKAWAEGWKTCEAASPPPEPATPAP